MNLWEERININHPALEPIKTALDMALVEAIQKGVDAPASVLTLKITTRGESDPDYWPDTDLPPIDGVNEYLYPIEFEITIKQSATIMKTKGQTKEMLSSLVDGEPVVKFQQTLDQYIVEGDDND